MDLTGLKDQVRKFKAEHVWDAAHKNIVEVLKLVNLGSDIASKYENDYARERSRYLDMAIAYRVSNGADLGVIRIAGLERQGEQHDVRPPPKRERRRRPRRTLGSAHAR